MDSFTVALIVVLTLHGIREAEDAAQLERYAERFY